MLEAQFKATDDADWKEALELINDETSEPLDEVADGVFSIEVSDCGSAVLSATTDDGSGILTKPGDGVVQWRFPKSLMCGLNAKTTYTVGLTMTYVVGPDTIVEQIMVASLAIVDGGF